MQRIFRANKMADTRIINADTGDSSDVSCVKSSRRANRNTYLAQSVSRPCKCMHFLFNSLMFTTLLTKKHDQVALLIDSAFTWSS